MVRSRGVRRLTPAEEEWLQAEVAAGRRPYVLLVDGAGDLPPGSRVRVVRLDDPAAGEYVVASVQGDQLPFSPREVGLPPTSPGRDKSADVPPAKRQARESRGGAPSRATRPAATGSSSSRSRSDAVTSSVQRRTATPADGPTRVTRKAAPARSPRGAAAAQQRTTAAAPASRGGRGKSAPPEPTESRSRRSADATATSAAARKPSARRRGALPPVTVVLSFEEGRGWTVEARAGNRRHKPVAVRPSSAAAAAAALDAPTVADFVIAVTDAQRTEAEEEARRLRDELAQVEATLAEFGRR